MGTLARKRAITLSKFSGNNPCKKDSVQTPCKLRANSVQTPCKLRANPVRNRANPVQTPCKPRANPVQTQGRPRRCRRFCGIPRIPIPDCAVRSSVLYFALFFNSFGLYLGLNGGCGGRLGHRVWGGAWAWATGCTLAGFTSGYNTYLFEPLVPLYHYFSIKTYDFPGGGRALSVPNTS